MKESEPRPLTFQRLNSILAGPAAAIRLRTRLQFKLVVLSDKVFSRQRIPAGFMRVNPRRIDDKVVKTVLLDSVPVAGEIVSSWRRSYLLTVPASCGFH